MFRRYKDNYVVYISGPDGSGKSTIIEGLVKSITKDNIHVRTFHHVNDVLDRELMFTKVSKITKHISWKPLRVRCETFLVEVYYLIKFRKKLKQESRKCNLIIVDRCIIDKVCSAYVRNLKYLYRVRRVLSRFFPRPNSTIIIYANADEIVGRKKELSRVEVLKYYDFLDKLGDSKWNKLVVKNRNVDSAIRDIREWLYSLKFEMNKLHYSDSELVPIIKKHRLIHKSLNNTGFMETEGSILIKRAGDIDSVVDSITLESIRRDVKAIKYCTEEHNLGDRVKFRFYDANRFFIYQFDIRIEHYGATSQ